MSSLMVARVGSRPIFLSVVRVVSHLPSKCAEMGDICDRLKSGSTSMLLLT